MLPTLVMPPGLFGQPPASSLIEELVALGPILRSNITCANCAEGSVRVSAFVQHGPGKSFYVKNPNQIQLEFTATMRELDSNDASGSFAISRAMLDPED